mgnify:CR=1 FL=1
MQKGNWGILFAGIQSVCAVIVTIITVYGVFFTDLPDLLINQLRAELATAEIKLSELRLEKLRIQDELEEKSNTLEELNTALYEAKKERKAYFNKVKNTVILEYISLINSILKKHRDIAEFAKSYPDFMRYLDRREMIWTKIMEAYEGGKRGLLQKNRSVIKEMEEELAFTADGTPIPKYWYAVMMRPYIKDIEDNSNDMSYQFESFLREEISQLQVVASVKDMLLEYSSIDGINMLLPSDRKHFITVIQNFILNNKKLVSDKILPNSDEAGSLPDIIKYFIAKDDEREKIDLLIKDLEDFLVDNWSIE